jgi:hypothetical protein
MGSASQVWIGATDGSRIFTSIGKSWNERQFRRTLPRNGPSDLRTETRRILSKRAECLVHWSVGWNDYVHEKVPAVGRRRYVFNEQIVQAIVGMPICQREIQRALHLPAELPRLSFSLPSR